MTRGPEVSFPVDWRQARSEGQDWQMKGWRAGLGSLGRERWPGHFSVTAGWTRLRCSARGCQVCRAEDTGIWEEGADCSSILLETRPTPWTIREQLFWLYKHGLLFSCDPDATRDKNRVREKDSLGQGVLANQLWGEVGVGGNEALIWDVCWFLWRECSLLPGWPILGYQHDIPELGVGRRWHSHDQILAGSGLWATWIWNSGGIWFGVEFHG